MAITLLELNASPDLQDNDGYTVAMWSVFDDNMEFLELMIEYDADLTLEDDTGRQVCQIAQQEYDEDEWSGDNGFLDYLIDDAGQSQCAYPDKPSAGTTTFSKSEATFSWSAPSTNGNTITKYEIYV